jgi:hypothetical protein
MMLSPVSWTGGGGDNYWSDAKNWSSNSLPGASDDVVIGSGYAVVADIDVAIDNLQVQTGASLSDEGGMTVSDGLTNSGTLDLAGANLTVSSGLTNRGTLRMGGLEGQTLTVSSGVFLNATGGTVLCDPPASDDAYITANLNNQGTITATSGYVHFNNADGSTSPPVTSNTFLNTGMLKLADNTMCILAGLANPGALGTFGGDGFLQLAGVSWSLSGNWTIPSANGVIVGFAGSSLTASGTVTNPAGSTVVLMDSTINANVNNWGDIGAWYSSTVNGQLTLEDGSTVAVGFATLPNPGNGHGLPTQPFSLTVTNGVTNHGQLQLFNVMGGSMLTVSGGTLVNAADGTVASFAGFNAASGSAPVLNANIDNQGTINVNGSDLVINQGTGTSAYTLTNEAKSTIDVGTGQTLTIGGASVTDDGVIEIGGTATVDFSVPTVTIDGQGTLQGQSTSTVDIGGSLLGNTTNVAGFSPPGTVLLDGQGTASSPQRLELMETDQGNVTAGYTSNLAYGTLQLGGGTYVQLVNQFQNSSSSGSKAEAGYADSLVVPAGSTFDKNGLNFYAMNLTPVPITTPTITWNPPAAITYGTALGKVQLDATTGVAGTFSYSPALGTVLHAGTQTLSATFTPKDTADYTTATASVNLTVNKAVLKVTAGSKSRPYGAANPPLTYVIAGYVNGDRSSVASGAPSLVTKAVAASVPGVYPISVTLGTLAANDYSFKLVGGSLTVAHASTTTTIDDLTNPSGQRQATTFIAIVTPVAPGAGTPTGTVTFKDGKKTLGTQTLSGGRASFTISSLALGKNSITAVYSGDGDFTASTSPTDVHRVWYASKTALSDSAVVSAFGQAVTLTAKVTAVTAGNGTPAGSVTFRDGATTLGTVKLKGGKASLTVSDLSAGNHAITAVYNTNGTFGDSLSATDSHTVERTHTTTALSKPTNPSTAGQAVKFTATVKAVAPGAGTPTGTVTFMDGQTVLGTVQLSGDTASFTTSTLAAGQDTITAVYNGDDDFAASTSPVDTHEVASSQAVTTIGATPEVTLADLAARDAAFGATDTW